MVTAFVLINVEDTKLNEIADAVLSLPGVSEVHVVAGEYDMIAVIRTTDNTRLSELLTKHIIHTPGIKRTKTLISLEAYANFDLDSTFNG
ncbi:MAG: Lrp/AsnC ligand binding domain-containing protein [Candidatus Pacebacteria bacterium]|nr:Lrp/AsnC ligand binding domain-containing protein [Candidatus Paceibacterota bacterium]